MHRTIGAALAASLKDNASKIAIIEHDGAYAGYQCSFEELGQQASGLAHVYSQFTEESSSVGLLMRRSAAHVSAIVAAVQSNRLFYSINPSVSGTQFAHMVGSTNTEIIVSDTANLIKLASFASQHPAKFRVILIEDGDLNAVQETALSNLSQSTEVLKFSTTEIIGAQLYRGRSSSRTASGDDALQILFTSGSSGIPKSVVLRNKDVLLRAQSEIEAYEIQHHDRLLNILPFSFDVGCNQLYSALLSGCTLVTLNSWLPRDIVSAFKEHAITGISGVPAIWSPLLEIDADTLEVASQSLRYLTISGGSLPPVQQETLRRKLSNTHVFKTYGQTETFRSTMLRPGEIDRKGDTVGRPVPGVNIAIIKPDGSRAGPGEKGEIVHAGRGTMLGYHQDPKGTEQKLRPAPSWLETGGQPVVFTGDCGTIDTEGFLTILGRMDRMLKIKGNRVYPEEIENQVLEHPNVVDAVALENGPDRLKVILRVKPDGALSPIQLMQFLARRLPSYMIPQDYDFVGNIPKTSTGKTDLATVSGTTSQQERSLDSHEA